MADRFDWGALAREAGVGTPKGPPPERFDWGALAKEAGVKAPPPAPPAPPPAAEPAPVPSQARPPYKDAASEADFQAWYGPRAQMAGLGENPDDPLQQYDYRRAFEEGVEPTISPEDGLYHWPSDFKLAAHPNRFVDGRDTVTEQPTSWGAGAPPWQTGGGGPGMPRFGDPGMEAPPFAIPEAPFDPRQPVLPPEPRPEAPEGLGGWAGRIGRNAARDVVNLPMMIAGGADAATRAAGGLLAAPAHGLMGDQAGASRALKTAEESGSVVADFAIDEAQDMIRSPIQILEGTRVVRAFPQVQQFLQATGLTWQDFVVEFENQPLGKILETIPSVLGGHAAGGALELTPDHVADAGGMVPPSGGPPGPPAPPVAALPEAAAVAPPSAAAPPPLSAMTPEQFYGPEAARGVAKDQLERQAKPGSLAEGFEQEQAAKRSAEIQKHMAMIEAELGPMHEGTGEPGAPPEGVEERRQRPRVNPETRKKLDELYGKERPAAEAPQPEPYKPEIDVAKEFERDAADKFIATQPDLSQRRGELQKRAADAWERRQLVSREGKPREFEERRSAAREGRETTAEMDALHSEARRRQERMKADYDARREKERVAKEALEPKVEEPAGPRFAFDRSTPGAKGTTIDWYKPTFDAPEQGLRKGASISAERLRELGYGDELKPAAERAAPAARKVPKPVEPAVKPIDAWGPAGRMAAAEGARGTVEGSVLPVQEGAAASPGAAVVPRVPRGVQPRLGEAEPGSSARVRPPQPARTLGPEGGLQEGAARGTVGAPAEAATMPGLQPGDVEAGRAPQGLQPAARGGLAVPEMPRPDTPEGRAAVRERRTAELKRQESEVDAKIADASKRLSKKLSKVHSGVDLSGVKEVVELGALTARKLALRSVRGVADFESWAAEMVQHVKSLTTAQLRKVWNAREVRIAKERFAESPQETAPYAPHAQGRERYLRRLHGDKGGQVFHEARVARDRVEVGARAISDRLKATFRGLKREEREALYHAASGVVRDSTGKTTYGSILRAGTERVKAGGLFEQPGTLLPDGRMVGNLTADGRSQQLYRIFWPDEAKAAHDALTPKAKEVLEAILAQTETPIFTSYGDRLPTMSRSVMKDHWGIEGLEADEAQAAASLARAAYGPAGKARGIPNEFAWVPETAEPTTAGKTFRRVRNAMRDMKSTVRKQKGGVMAERIREGSVDYDIGGAFVRAHVDLFREQIHNDLAARLLHLSAEQIPKGQRGPSPGYTEFSLTGLAGESRKLREFVLSHREWFEQAGIDVPDVLTATHMAGGKVWQIKTKVLNEIVPERKGRVLDPSPKFQAMVDAVDDLASQTIATINLFRLTRVSTANRNWISNAVVMSQKAIRDYYRAVLESVPGLGSGELSHPWLEAHANIRALGSSLRRSTRERLPAEALGTTFTDAMSELGGPGKESAPVRAGARMLRLTGFNLADVWTKRTVKEAVYDAWARRGYYQAKAKGTLAGQSKKDFIAAWKKAVPKEIEQLAYREMDTWGGYDYWNIPKWLQAVKRSKAGRATIPYPTYFVKLTETAWEMTGKPMVTLASKSSTRGQRINAVATLMATATTMGALWAALDEDEADLPKGVKETDLPYEVQRFGRMRLPLPEKIEAAMGLHPDEDLWVRLYDIPFVGEVMFAKAWSKGQYSFADYFNDRIALGPMFQMIATVSGLSNRFNAEMPRASRVGREMASWLPFQAEAGTLRRFVDPWKREVGDERRGAFYNWAAGMADHYPGLSMLLPERQFRFAFQKYPPLETTLSYALLNVKAQGDAERKAAIRIAQIAYLSEEKTMLERDQVREMIRGVHDWLGETDASKLYESARTHDDVLNIELSKVMIGTEMLRHRQDWTPAQMMEHARTEAMKLEPKLRGPVMQSAQRLMKRLAQERQLGLPGKVIRSAPPRIRGELMQRQQAK